MTEQEVTEKNKLVISPIRAPLQMPARSIVSPVPSLQSAQLPLDDAEEVGPADPADERTGKWVACTVPPPPPFLTVTENDVQNVLDFMNQQWARQAGAEESLKRTETDAPLLPPPVQQQ